MTMWALASLTAAASIIGIEWANRYHGGSWLEVLRVTAPLIVLAQFALFYSWRHAPHMIAAWLVFSLATSALRLAVVWGATDEPFAWWGAIGLAVMLVGALIVNRAMA